MQNYSILIHGGSGTLSREALNEKQEKAYKATLKSARDTGYIILENGGSALDAVEKAVNVLEDSSLFNAGKGSVFNADGENEMEASIMNGQNRKAGAVAVLKGIKNPISLARDVMEKSNHVFLAADGALKFAKSQGYKMMGADYFYDRFRYEQWQKIKGTDDFELDHDIKKNSKIGTVGAVACDGEGNVAAATSTGGMTNKKQGRIGDSGMIGAGCYAHNKTCAVSCTGSGEYFIRGAAAYDISALMEYKGLSVEDAASEVIQKRMLELGGDGGLIAVDSKARLAMSFNTEGMYRAFKSSAGSEGIKIYKEE